MAAAMRSRVRLPLRKFLSPCAVLPVGWPAESARARQAEILGSPQELPPTQKDFESRAWGAHHGQRQESTADLLHRSQLPRSSHASSSSSEGWARGIGGGQGRIGLTSPYFGGSRAPWIADAGPGMTTRSGVAVQQQQRRGVGSRPFHEAVVEEVEGCRYKTKVTTGLGGKHTFYSDLAYGDGEGDSTPAPMDYAISSVALCTTMTVRLYAERKGWPLERIKVEVKEDRSKGAGHIPDGLVLTLHFKGSLTEEQRQRLLEISGKCPVKQLMMGKMPKGVVTSLAPE